MQVVNEITKKPIDRECAIKIVINHVPGSIIFGYCISGEELIRFIAYTPRDGFNVYVGLKKRLKHLLIYSNYRGIYISKVDLPDSSLLKELYCKGSGGFPYTFERKYEAVENFNIFDGKQRIVSKPIVYNLSKYLKYTFGLEFETSQGYIPEEICFRDGLIPLRDGSITGLEYSTVVLNGNDGIRLLKQQLGTLKKYTNFNKECSLHIHLGGYPLNSDKLFSLYLVCKNLECELTLLIPDYTFFSHKYKKNGKDYCKPLPNFISFQHMYKTLVGKPFFGSLTQAHPNDIERNRKWQVDGRYFWVNFINSLCYNVNKTIEFRFLRPTYNFNKIVLWIYILNAIMYFSENSNKANPSLNDIIDFTYPEDISSKIKDGIIRLKILKENQTSNGDLIGRDLEIEHELFPDKSNFY